MKCTAIVKDDNNKIIKKNTTACNTGIVKLKQKKIFCVNCKHIEDEPCGYCCEHPNNMVTWYSDKKEHNIKIGRYGKEPKELNENNDCTLFEQKQE